MIFLGERNDKTPIGGACQVGSGCLCSKATLNASLNDVGWCGDVEGEGSSPEARNKLHLPSCFEACLWSDCHLELAEGEESSKEHVSEQSGTLSLKELPGTKFFDVLKH